jgi:hypothetical protein
MKTINKIILTILAILVPCNYVWALTQSITANVAFATPLSVSTVVNANFGSVSAGVASTVYAITPAGSISVTSGPGVSIDATAAVPASFTVIGSSSQTFTATAASYVAAGGVTPSLATCAYNSGGTHACDGSQSYSDPGAGKTLAMGLTITTTGSEADGATAAPTFVMTLVYN